MFAETIAETTTETETIAETAGTVSEYTVGTVSESATKTSRGEMLEQEPLIPRMKIN